MHLFIALSSCMSGRPETPTAARLAQNDLIWTDAGVTELDLATAPNTSCTIVGEGSLTGLFTGLSSGDPQRPSRRLAVSCRWSWSWPCAELTVDRVSCRRTAGPGLAGGREPPRRGRPGPRRSPTLGVPGGVFSPPPPPRRGP